jgi:hypothetical protein
MKRQLRLDRLKSVEREYGIAIAALDMLQRLIQGDPNVLDHQGLAVSDLRIYSEWLPATYIVRIFAEFEAALRELWQSIRDTDPPVADLIYSIAGRYSISNDWQDAVHQVRLYRNRIVHLSTIEVAPVAMRSARSALCRFLSRVPADW